MLNYCLVLLIYFSGIQTFNGKLYILSHATIVLRLLRNIVQLKVKWVLDIKTSCERKTSPYHNPFSKMKVFPR